MNNFILVFLFLSLTQCKEVNTNSIKKLTPSKTQIKCFKEFTTPSKLPNLYSGFNSPNAINRIAKIENEYFNKVNDSFSRYYGTEWKSYAETSYPEKDTVDLFTYYSNEINKKGLKPDSFHCTIYAVEALKAGLGENFPELEKSHKRIWKDREYAGWSIGYLLTEELGWKAYLFLSENSNEYQSCIKNFKKDQKYHVWRQPDIKIEQLFDVDNDKSAIDSLLNLHEFGWGFSEQGWHTWITRFDTLKECNWLGAPSIKYNDVCNKPLFLSTKFTDYIDYNSHILIFPPKK